MKKSSNIIAKKVLNNKLNVRKNALIEKLLNSRKDFECESCGE